MQRYSLFSLARHALTRHRHWQPAWRTPALRERYEVVIIGAGGHGLAAAHYLAREHGTPLYVYSASCVRDRFRELRTAFGDGAQICYAVKANSNLSILKLLASLGAGFDLVSGGELLRVQKAGIDASRAIFAGAAKQRWEIELGAKLGVRAFQVESPHEIELLSAVAAAQSKRLPVALRLNPAVAVDTHAYIATAKRDSKFGIELARAGEAVSRIAKDPGLQLVGYHVHLGSQLRSVDQDDLELYLIDHGLEEMGESTGEKGEPQLVVRCAFEDFGKVQEALEARKISPLKAEHEYIPNAPTELGETDAAEVLSLIDKLEQDDDVQSVFHTLA